ncbi:MAG: amphi-Trp domain-containing protein [Desulfonatronovibrionaceae bacterium]
MSKKEMKTKGVLAKQDLILWLENIVQALKQGHVTFENQNEVLDLRPGEAIEAEIKAKSKTGKEKIAIELSWKTQEQMQLKALDLKIAGSSQTTAPPAEIVSKSPVKKENPEAPASSSPTIAMSTASEEPAQEAGEKSFLSPENEEPAEKDSSSFKMTIGK